MPYKKQFYLFISSILNIMRISFIFLEFILVVDIQLIQYL